MTSLDIAQLRLQNQKLIPSNLKKPADLVQWFGAIQAQDYHGAKWALGLRLQEATGETIEHAFARGEILRTHVMRPTWHFVAPADIRWLLSLTAPRVNARNAHNYRRFELDGAVFRRTNKALAKALRGGRQLTREALRVALQRAGVATDDLLRLTHILARAELDGVICSGARQGKQFTYALLDERVPKTEAPGRDEALAELTRRYFKSHGPATVPDFVWWSGLTAGDARRGLEMVESHLENEVVDGKSYWLWSSTQSVKRGSRTAKEMRAGLEAHLLPPFDEYFVSYKDRSAALEGTNNRQGIRDSELLGSMIVIDGRVMGTWKRTFDKNTVIITLSPFTSLARIQNEAVFDAANRYGAFLGMKVVLEHARKATFV